MTDLEAYNQPAKCRRLLSELINEGLRVPLVVFFQRSPSCPSCTTDPDRLPSTAPTRCSDDCDEGYVKPNKPEPVLKPETDFEREMGERLGMSKEDNLYYLKRLGDYAGLRELAESSRFAELEAALVELLD